MRGLPVTRAYPLLLELDRLVPCYEERVEGPRSGSPSGLLADVACVRKSVREPWGLSDELRTPCTPGHEIAKFCEPIREMSDRIDNIAEELHNLQALEWV